MKFPVYLDYNATTPCDERVVEAMLPFFTRHFGNAASRSHAYGWEAEEGVEYAREQVAKLVGADNKLVVFLHPKSTGGVLIELVQELR